MTSANTRDTDARAGRVAAVISVLLKRKSFQIRRVQRGSFSCVVDAASMDKEVLQLTYTFARGTGWNAQRARLLVRRVNAVLRQSDALVPQVEGHEYTKVSSREGSAL